MSTINNGWWCKNLSWATRSNIVFGKILEDLQEGNPIGDPIGGNQ